METYVIEERRICWPDPDATCLNGGCGWCNTEPFRKLTTIERWASKAGTIPHRGVGADDALHAFQYGLDRQFFNVETRTSRDRLAAYADSLGVEALKKLAEGMPGGTHGRRKADILAWLMRHRRHMLDDTFKRNWNASQVVTR
jgi:hypothetical protein